jgi:hypothetical protein
MRRLLYNKGVDAFWAQDDESASLASQLTQFHRYKKVEKMSMSDRDGFIWSDGKLIP